MPVDDPSFIDHNDIAARARIDSEKPPPEPYEEGFNWWPHIFLCASIFAIGAGGIYYKANGMMEGAIIPLIIAGAISLCVYIYWLFND